MTSTLAGAWRETVLTVWTILGVIGLHLVECAAQRGAFEEIVPDQLDRIEEVTAPSPSRRS